MASIPDECPITFEAFTEKGDQQPLVMPKCGHTFSKSAISGLVSQARERLKGAATKRRGSRLLVPIKCPACGVQQNVSSASDCPPNWSIIQRLQEPVLASSSNAKGYETNPQHSSLDEEGAGATLQQAADQIESVGSEDCTDALTVQREPQVVSSEDALACLPSTLVSDREATSHSPAVPSSCAPVRCIRQPQQKGSTVLPACITVNRAEGLTGNQVVSNRFVLYEHLTALARRALKAYVAAEDAASVGQAISELMIKQAETTDSLVEVLAKKLPILHHIGVEWPYMARTRHIENLDAVTMRARLLHCNRLNKQLDRMNSAATSDSMRLSSSNNPISPSVATLAGQASCGANGSGVLHSSPGTARNSAMNMASPCSGREAGCCAQNQSQEVQMRAVRSGSPTLNNATLTAAEALVATEIFEEMYTELMYTPELATERSVHAAHACQESSHDLSQDASSRQEDSHNTTSSSNISISLDGFEPQRVFTAALHYFARMAPMCAGATMATETSVLASALLPSVEALLVPVLGHREIVNSIVSHAILVGARDCGEEDCVHCEDACLQEHACGNVVKAAPHSNSCAACTGVAHEGVISPRDLGDLGSNPQGASNPSANNKRDRSNVRKTAMHVCRVLATHAANADSLLALCSTSCCMHELPALVDAALDYLVATEPDAIDMHAPHAVARVPVATQNHACANSMSTGAAQIDAAAAMAAATHALNLMHVGPSELAAAAAHAIPASNATRTACTASAVSTREKFNAGPLTTATQEQRCSACQSMHVGTSSRPSTAQQEASIDAPGPEHTQGRTDAAEHSFRANDTGACAHESQCSTTGPSVPPVATVGEAPAVEGMNPAPDSSSVGGASRVCSDMHVARPSVHQAQCTPDQESSEHTPGVQHRSVGAGTGEACSQHHAGPSVAETPPQQPPHACSAPPAHPMLSAWANLIPTPMNTCAVPAQSTQTMQSTHQSFPVVPSCNAAAPCMHPHEALRSVGSASGACMAASKAPTPLPSMLPAASGASLPLYSMHCAQLASHSNPSGSNSQVNPALNNSKPLALSFLPSVLSAPTHVQHVCAGPNPQLSAAAVRTVEQMPAAAHVLHAFPASTQSSGLIPQQQTLVQHPLVLSGQGVYMHAAAPELMQTPAATVDPRWASQQMHVMPVSGYHSIHVMPGFTGVPGGESQYSSAVRTTDSSGNHMYNALR